MKNKSNAGKDKSRGVKNKSNKGKNKPLPLDKLCELLESQLETGKYTDLVHYIEIREDIDHYQELINANQFKEVIL